MRSDRHFSIRCTGKGDLLVAATIAFSPHFEVQFLNCSHQLEKRTREWLKSYFDGNPPPFDIPCELQGTPFQKAVWDVLKKIPFGETKSYAQVADEAGIPKGSRAVGNACGKNRLILFIPCHRVIRSDSTVGGFAVDSEIKRRLLNFEKTRLERTF